MIKSIREFRHKKTIAGIILAISSTMIMPSKAMASRLQITIENLNPPPGALITPLWLGIHDGSFDSFDIGSPASSGIEIVAEEGFIGFEDLIGTTDFAPPEIFPDFDDTIAGEFAASSAADNGGIQTFLTGTFFPPAGILAGETNSIILNIEDPSVNRFFNYAGMFLPSNDGFIGNPDPLEIFDINGNFIPTEIILTPDIIWDAGTEVNDEDPFNIPFSGDLVGNGISEGGVIGVHPGFINPPGSPGSIFDVGIELPGTTVTFTNGDFTGNPDFVLGRITITQVPESNSIIGLLSFGILGGSYLFSRKNKVSS